MTQAECFNQYLVCDEFTRWEIFLSLGQYDERTQKVEIKFKDGSVATNLWNRKTLVGQEPITGVK